MPKRAKSPLKKQKVPKMHKNAKGNSKNLQEVTKIVKKCEEGEI